jgi:hypothetical protein
VRPFSLPAAEAPSLLAWRLQIANSLSMSAWCDFACAAWFSTQPRK